MDKYINPPEFLEEQKKKPRSAPRRSKEFPTEPQKDILAFLLENAPMEEWQHEVLAIVRDEAYYFAPQGQTKIMNEGWASYWHSKILTEKALRDSEIVDFCDHHAGVMAMQPGRINPYKIGIELLREIEDRWNAASSAKITTIATISVAQSRVGQEARAWAGRRSSRFAAFATTSPSSTSISPRSSRSG